MSEPTIHSLPSQCGGAAGGGFWLCINGEVYGPCEHEGCGGICEAAGACKCSCHDESEAER